MSTKREHLVETAERLFYLEGFHGTGVDRVIAEAGVARMTLYKHFPSKDDLVFAVLERRDHAYWSALTEAVEQARLEGGSLVLAIFDAHGRWLEGEGRHGCLFLKAIGEYAHHHPAIARAAADHKSHVLTFLRELLQAEAISMDGNVDQQLVMLLEGATALAQILPPHEVAQQALATAQHLIDSAGRS